MMRKSTYSILFAVLVGSGLSFAASAETAQAKESDKHHMMGESMNMGMMDEGMMNEMREMMGEMREMRNECRDMMSSMKEKQAAE